MSDEPVQVFVRTDAGATFGPLAPTSVELLLDNGVVTGRVQISLDGVNYVFPGRVPGLRMVFPRAMWGDVVEPGNEADAAWAKAVLPPVIQGAAAPPTSSPSRIGVSPGAPPVLAAGPGARASAIQPRPVARPSGISRPSQIIAPAIAPVVAASPARPAPPMIAMPTAAEQPDAAVTTDPGDEWLEPLTDPEGVASEPPAAEPVSLLGTDLPPSGPLGVMGPIRLYFLVASTQRTGLLTLTLPDRVIQLHFRKGAPEFVDSNHAEDALAAFLIKRQLLTAEVIAKAEAQKARFGGELLPTLFALGLLNPNTVFAQLGQRAADLVYRALVTERGTYTWQVVDLPPTRAMPMGNTWSVFIEQLRRVPAAEVRRRMASALDLPVMKGQGPVPAADLKLSPQELRALNSFDGVRSLNQLATQLPAEADVMLRTAWVLQFCEVVSFATAILKNDALPSPPVRLPPVLDEPINSPPVAVVKPPGNPVGAPGNPASMNRPQTVSYPSAKPKAPPPVVMQAASVPPVMVPGPPKISAPIASAAPAAASPAEVKALGDLLETLRKQNFYEVLDVTQDADALAVKTAYFKRAKMYHPDAIPMGTPEAIAKLKTDIFARVSDAYKTLSDPKLRANYLGEIAAGGTGDKVDIANILAAEEAFQKGMILVKARKFAEAVKMLTDAIAASDIEGEYYAWRGWAKFFLYPDKKQGQLEAMKDLALCAKKNPNVAAMYYFQGYMAKVLGDVNTAKSNFKKTVELDPRHIDAQRELRMMK